VVVQSGDGVEVEVAEGVLKERIKKRLITLSWVLPTKYRLTAKY